MSRAIAYWLRGLSRAQQRGKPLESNKSHQKTNPRRHLDFLGKSGQGFACNEKAGCAARDVTSMFCRTRPPCFVEHVSNNLSVTRPTSVRHVTGICTSRDVTGISRDGRVHHVTDSVHHVMHKCPSRDVHTCHSRDLQMSVTRFSNPSIR